MKFVTIFLFEFSLSYHKEVYQKKEPKMFLTHWNVRFYLIAVIKTDKNDPLGLTGVRATNCFIISNFELINEHRIRRCPYIYIYRICNQFYVPACCGSSLSPAPHSVVILTVQENDVDTAGSNPAVSMTPLNTLLLSHWDYGIFN
jgi:hypothetical protein